MLGLRPTRQVRGAIRWPISSHPTETLSREETAKLLVSLADALSAGNGHARLLLGDTSVQLRVPERMQVEVEVEVDGNEVELEIELSWLLRERVKK
jgi:amphi-Trp domain-containing protein